MARRGWMWAGLALPVLLVAGDVVAWRVATGRLADGLAEATATLGAAGWRLASDAPVREGFPFGAWLRLDHAVLSRRTPGVSWTADRVAVGVSVFAPHRLQLVPTGAQALVLPEVPPLTLRAGSLVASIPLGGPVRAARAEAHQLAVQGPFGVVQADRVQLDASWAEGAARLALSTGPVQLPAGVPAPLGATIPQAAVALVAHGALPAAGDALAGWRDAGGWVDVTALRLQWGPLDLHGSGRLQLDSALRPQGSLDTTVADPAAVLSMLADGGAIGRGPALAAGAVLGLLAAPARLAGQAPTLDLPLKLRDGVVSLGAIPLAKLP